MNKHKNYLAKYRDDPYRFIVRKDECGDYNIQLRTKPSLVFRTVYDIYLYSDNHLAAVVPPLNGKYLVKDFPFLKVYGEGDDGTILLFPEENLNDREFVRRLRIKRRRKLSGKGREKAIRNLIKF